MFPPQRLPLQLVKSNRLRIEELCGWIEANATQAIGWEALCRLSGWSQRDLLMQFAIHRRTTPMTHIRGCRQRGALVGVGARAGVGGNPPQALPKPPAARAHASHQAHS